ncbi:unnamed protein product [Pleuronectes platessa]|uniref:Uncharacterized protein n=1 Tax=Pleuronectes platessa TaxID=8262 RepID=A0A9N7TPU2_PLEPL|nr:unnamed protein product [Pleuronectes platessa]
MDIKASEGASRKHPAPVTSSAARSHFDLSHVGDIPRASPDTHPIPNPVNAANLHSRVITPTECRRKECRSRHDLQLHGPQRVDANSPGRRRDGGAWGKVSGGAGGREREERSDGREGKARR